MLQVNMTSEEIEQKDLKGFCADSKEFLLNHPTVVDAAEDLGMKTVMKKMTGGENSLIKTEPLPDNLKELKNPAKVFDMTVKDYKNLMGKFVAWAPKTKLLKADGKH